MRNTISIIIAIVIAFWPCYASGEIAQISVDSRVKFQHVTGFGGFSPSPTWQYWLKDKQMDMLFGKEDNQLGLNILRLYMANNKTAWNAGVTNAKRAKKHGAFIFASPWSPPGAWKSNSSDSNGGELLEEYWDDWAKFLNDYYLYMKNQGVEIDAVSIQNEPDWNASYQSCIWTGEKMAQFIKQYGHLIECKIIAPEGIHFTPSMHEPILKDPDACARLDIVGGHFYGWNGSSYPLARQKGKEVWMTEYLINERQNNDHIDINWKDDGFLFARSINDAMLANMSAWVHYSLKRFYGCIGDGTYGTKDNEITKRGWILSHYAKYVSGTTRVMHRTTDPTGALSSSAYLTESGDSVVVMVLNPSDNEYDLDIELPFYTLSGRQIITSETDDMYKEDLELEDETYEPTVYIDPWSVNTLIFVKSKDRDDLIQEDFDGELVFTDDFEIYGASCVPPGWVTRGESETRHEGSYSLGPRIMAFSREGLMDHAFYFRSGTASGGYVTYGDEADYPLTLAPGSYTLSFSTLGWKATPKLSVKVQNKSTRKNVVEDDCTPWIYISENGPSVKITETCDHNIKFEISEEANYILRWTVTKATGGYNEALLGNVSLVRQEGSGIIDIVIDMPQSDVIYDLEGRKVNGNLSPGIYIRGGKKFIVR